MSIEKTGEADERHSDAGYYADTMEKEKKADGFSDMNLEKGLMVNALGGGLNRERGVFDATALFVTRQGE